MLRLLPHPVRIGLLLAFAAGLLASCSSNISSSSRIWDEDGRSVEDLRQQNLKGRHSFPLAPGAVLYADAITFSDAGRKHGTAEGRVYLYVAPQVRYAWLVERGYAGKAEFDLRQHTLVLKDRPMLERKMMIQVAAADYTTFEIRWHGVNTEVAVVGPTRTDFAKSHPVPYKSPGSSHLTRRSFPAVPGGAS